MNDLADPTTEQKVSSELLLLSELSPKMSCELAREVNVQPEGDDQHHNSNVKPRLLTVSYSCLVIVQTWLIFGLTVGYTSPVLSDLQHECDDNSSAPLDKIVYQDLFSVSEIKPVFLYCIYFSYQCNALYTEQHKTYRIA